MKENKKYIWKGRGNTHTFFIYSSMFVKEKKKYITATIMN